MSEETEATETPAKGKPGRKAGTKMKRDSQGRLLKKDGTLAKAPGRKAKGTKATKKTKKKKKPGRPVGSKNKKKTTVKKKTRKTKFKVPSDLVAAFKNLDDQRAKLTIVARKEIESVAYQIAECTTSQEKGLIRKLHQLKEMVA